MANNVFSGVFGGGSDSGRAYDSDVLAWEAAVIAAGGSVSLDRRIALDQYVYALKSNGIWSGLTRLWVHAGENEQQALLDLKALATASKVNNPAFTPNRWYTVNGTSSYLNLNLLATAAAPYTQNDASFGGWIGGFTGGGGVDFGYDYGGYSMLVANAGASLVRFEINAGTNPSGVPNIGAFTPGLYHGQRTGAATSALFRNGISVLTSTAPSVALQAKNFGVGAYVAGPVNFSTGQYALSFVGASLAGKEAAFYAATRVLMTSIGVP